jgi:ATP-dependent Clp protease protease subunit
MRLICKVPDNLLASFHDETMKIAYNVTDDQVDVFLHGIVGDEYNQTDSLSIAQILSANRGKTVNLRVNSPGGLAYDGVAIYNAIDSHDGPTVGIIEGRAGSAASLAVMACDTVKCHSGGVFHPHYSLVMAFGHQAEIRDALAIQERLDEDLEAIYAEASGRSLEQVKADLLGPNGDGTVFSADQAKSAGYVDEVIQHNKRKESADSKTSPAARLNLYAAHNAELRTKVLDTLRRRG